MSTDDPVSKIKQIMRTSAPASKVIDFAAAATKRGRMFAAAEPPKQSIGINGNNNAGVIGNGNNIQITVRGVSRPKIQVMPGQTEVTNEQAAEIKLLVAAVAMASGTPYSQIYKTIYRKFAATSYLLIKRDRYEEVRRYLRRWIASKSLLRKPVDSEAMRKQYLSRIHAEENKVVGKRAEIRAYISGRFGTNTLAELQPGQLGEVIKKFQL